MLKPDDRAHLVGLLRPPPGCILDRAVGTTFSLDLLSALIAPLSFALFDWEGEDGRPVADPLAMLEALRRYGDRFTIFCQAGQIRLPGKYPPLVTFLEPCIHEVQPPDEEGIFHPKVWAMRFLTEDGGVLYRVLCLSRNLTFDRCWDTVVALDGELADRTKAIAANHPLGDFIAALPSWTLKRMPADRRKGIMEMSDELRRVRFSWPEGFENASFHFSAGGSATDPFKHDRGKSLIVAPFLSDSVLKEFAAGSSELHLVSRLESLQEVSKEALKACKSIQFLAPQAVAEGDEEEAPAVARDEVLHGLHAKLFVIDRGWNTSVFTGSFNATRHALQHNVEFMVELVGKRSKFGVDRFLKTGKGETCFADLLRSYDPDIESTPPDPSRHEMDELLDAVKTCIVKGQPRLSVFHSSEGDLFDMRLDWKQPSRWPKPEVEVRVWPITQKAERSQVLAERVEFSRLSYQGLTPLLAFSITAKMEGRSGESVFVMNLPTEAMPADRHDRVLASLVSGQEVRYLLFLLSSGDEDCIASGELLAQLSGESNSVAGGRPITTAQLLETLVRALHRNPSQLARVASLLESLKKAGTGTDGSVLLDQGFQEIWEPIWMVAQTEEGR